MWLVPTNQRYHKCVEKSKFIPILLSHKYNLEIVIQNINIIPVTYI